MSSHLRRVKAIELALTPRQVVLVWLRNALQAGTFKDGAQHSPPHRATVANAVYRNVRNGMKGQAESLIERAVRQARREADFLYLLVVNGNVAVLENYRQREREYVLLLGHYGTVLDAKHMKDELQYLRLSCLMFIESVIVLDAAISRITSEHLEGQPLLFPDCAAKLTEQLRMTSDLARRFNELAGEVGGEQIDLEQYRNSLQSETDDQIESWVAVARAQMLTRTEQRQ